MTSPSLYCLQKQILDRFKVIEKKEDNISISIFLGWGEAFCKHEVNSEAIKENIKIERFYQEYV